MARVGLIRPLIRSFFRTLKKLSTMRRRGSSSADSKTEQVGCCESHQQRQQQEASRSENQGNKGWLDCGRGTDHAPQRVCTRRRAQRASGASTGRAWRCGSAACSRVFARSCLPLARNSAPSCRTNGSSGPIASTILK